MLSHKKECAGRNVGIHLNERGTFLALISTICFLLSLTPAISAAEKIRVAFVSPTPVFAPTWVAKETGLFAKHGLDADVILLTGSPRLVQTLIAGDLDFAVVGLTAVMRARMQGAELAVLATTTNVSVMKLLVNRQSGIHRIEDLKGKVMGVSQYGSEADAFARIVVGKAGLKPDKDVAIIQMEGTRKWPRRLWPGSSRAGSSAGWPCSRPRNPEPSFLRTAPSSIRSPWPEPLP